MLLSLLMIQKRSSNAFSVGTLGIAAALLVIAPSPALASNPFFTPTGSQLDSDPILDIVPGGSITFSLFLNTSALTNQVRVNPGGSGNIFRYDAITGIGLLTNFDPSELGNPQFTNSGLFASSSTMTLGGAFSIRLARGLVATQTGNINLGSITFSTKDLINDGSTDFSLTAQDITQVDRSQLDEVDNKHTFSALEAGLGPSQIIEVQPVPGPLPILGAAAAFGWSRKLRKRLKSSKPEVISTTAL
jgi:hypothetical protein